SVEQADFPSAMVLRLVRKDVLRYGENPHQRGALYSLNDKCGANLVNSRQLHGKELSYNNLLDLDSALAMVRVLAGPSVVVIKHNNPCGASTAESLSQATRQALDGDPVSAFGSVLAINRAVDAAAAEVLVEPGRFIEAIVAPDFDPAALEILTTRPKWKDNVRLLRCGPLAVVAPATQFRQIEGGLLVQDADNQGDPEEEWKIVSQALPGDAQWSDLRFAWSLVRHVKSNAITVVKNKTLLGCGAGQMSRVDSVGLALTKAGDRVSGAVMGSDAFFPFADSIEQAAKAGISAVIQPGGSRRDDEVIAAADAHGLAMIFTGRRHFKH
ncbi:MAG TPA: bifunctional phosphoribosylaminoimidazolecarboxamide formyltransferase/IMP cyclohydrolase, partial [Pirellulales bacterium]|nr:bifunctional phosphoribosylaminoimidazolecarboxamide formyltransferase/IMP cyclohydrolase [Pirellulales bacterium]